MPWHVGKSSECPDSKPFAVLKNDTDEMVACHATQAEAEAQVRALYANEPAAKATWDAAYVNDLPDSAFACIDSGGEKEEGKTVPRSLRHYPHHNSSGAVDLPHLRNALARVAQTGTAECGEDHLIAHAKELKIGSYAKADMTNEERDAWLNGEIPRRLLAYPFSGPLPGGSKGLDMDNEYFDAKTDIKPDWFRERPVLWTHGLYPQLGADLTVIGKADNLGDLSGPGDEPDDDGWWVDVWLKAGSRRVRQIESLLERGGNLYGSVGTMPHMIRRGKAGHIECWPYFEQSLTTTPQNTHSGFRSAKSLLTSYADAEIPVSREFAHLLEEFEATITDLRADLSAEGDVAAKAGREVSGSNMTELDEWFEALSSVISKIDQMRSRIREKYAPPPAASGAPSKTAEPR